MRVDEIVKLVNDENQAVDVVHNLFRRFGWSGTWFMRQDAEDAIQERLEEVYGGNQSQDWVEELTNELMESYEYGKLEDRFTELGNERLADAAAVLIPEEDE